MAGIRTTTNEAVHLVLRYTYTKPVKTSIPKEKRGAVWYYDNKMCFVAWKECEQDEAGDTTTHTFSCPIFPYCVKVWYIFVGTIGGVPSPSNTAIFEAHMTWPPPPPPPPCALSLSKQAEELAGEGRALTISLSLERTVS